MGGRLGLSKGAAEVVLQQAASFTRELPPCVPSAHGRIAPPSPSPGPPRAPQRQRAKGRPYVVVFCGVNGVGKSTNLAKIAYWLGQHGAGVGGVKHVG